MRYKYKLSNLDCPNCALRIEEKLKSDKNIRYANVNFPKLTLTVDTDTKTNISTYKCDIIFGTFFNNFSKNNFSIIKNTPKYNPQIIKFQSAPCHNPVKNHTIKIFLSHFILDVLFPPSGIYT